MFNVINQAGILGWPMVLLLLINIFLAVKYSLKLFGSDEETNVDINKIIFIGILALSFGVFTHYLGLYQGLQLFQYLSAKQVASGYAISLVALMLGLGVFVVSGILWFFLRIKLNSILNGTIK